MIFGSSKTCTKSKPSDDSFSRDEIAIMVARLTLLTLTLKKLARVMGHFSTNPINSRIGTTQRLLHKSGKVILFGIKFLLLIEVSLSSRMRGQKR
jgi:hypothetical protein